MKNINLSIISLVAILALSSCNKGNVNMTTVINDDGTCEREIGICANSDELMSEKSLCANPRLAIDESWTKSWGVVGDEKRNEYPATADDCARLKAMLKSGSNDIQDTAMVYAKRSFKSVDEMCDNMPVKIGRDVLKSKAKLEKSFKWFYTDITYSETFTGVDKELPLPVTEFITKDEASFWFTGHPDLQDGKTPLEMSQEYSKIDDAVGKWVENCFVYEVFTFIAENYDSIANPPVSKADFLNGREDFIKSFDDMDILDIEKNMDECFRSFYKSDAYAEFFTEGTPLYNALQYELNDMMDKVMMFEMPYTLVMPGTVLATGDGKLTDQGTVVFKVSGSKLIAGDYTVTATSRVANIWAFLVTGLVFVFVICCFVYRKKA